MNKIRIVHGLHWSNGGIIKFLELLLSKIDLCMFEHHVIILNSDADSKHNLINYCSSYTSLEYDHNKLLGISRYLYKLNKLKPDIFHAHSFLPGILGRALYNKKFLCLATIHNEYPYYTSKSLRNIAKLKIEYYSLKRDSQSVICVSESVRKLVDRVMPGLPLDIIPNGVPRNLFDESIKHKMNDSLTILTIGRLDLQKGYDLLIDAFSILHREGINASLRIVGEGSLRSSLEAQARKLGIDDKVYMPGFIQNPVTELQNADIFVCSSRYEGFSLAIAEAMSFGLPLITTRVGGIAAMVRDRVEAIVVPIDNPPALAKAIRELIDKPALRYKIAENGRVFLNTKFDIMNTAKSYEKLYKRLVQKHGNLRNG